MSTITVLAPHYETNDASPVQLATRSIPTEPVVIAIIENSKANAKALLGYVADGLRDRLPVADVVVHSKSAAGKPIDADVAEMLAARAHLVISGLGD